MLLNPIISKLAHKLVVLASASPRRREILQTAGLQFEVVPSWFEETLDKDVFKAPYEYALETAKQKALEVARRMPLTHLKIPDLVIGADTIVTIDGVILEKPKDRQDAYRMLSGLSGKEHSVFTGVVIVFCHERERQVDYQLIDFYEETKVKFSALSEEMLWEYINSGEYADKAGGYGIQSLAGMLVEYVHGDYLNVVGFPLNHFCKQLDVIYKGCPSSLSDKSVAISRLKPPSVLVELPSGSTLPQNEIMKEKESQDGRENGGALPLTASGGQPKHTNESNGPKKNELQHMIALMDGFKASKALFVASQMHVFDVLHKRPGLDAAQVAQEISASVKGTESLLEACVSLKLLKCKSGAGQQKPVYKNTDVAKHFLLSDAPFSLLGYIQHCNITIWPLFSHLHAAVQEGVNQHHKAFNQTSENLFEDTVYNSQEAKLRFMNAMHSIAKVTGMAVATAFDLSSFRTACDLGGCTGAMAYEFTKAHPNLSVAVFDLQPVVELSEHFKPQDTDGRVSFIAGDFFKDQLPKADLYILARILHDWSDEKVHLLLSKVADACSPGSAVLISEIFLDESRSGPSRGLLQALSMCEGRQRSAAEYSLLLKNHGFIPADIRLTGNLLDAMLYVKKSPATTPQ
ncbi:putative bifunctional dTTP/UTP pyrophosphatase/methyltransferase protein isoform 1-T1 [Synchiropus picturatus]